MPFYMHVISRYCHKHEKIILILGIFLFCINFNQLMRGICVWAVVLLSELSRFLRYFSTILD